MEERHREAVLLALEMQEGATSQGKQQSLGTGEGKETDSHLGLPERNAALLAPGFQPREI